MHPVRTFVMTKDSVTQITICMGSSCFSRGNNRNLEIIQNYLAERKAPATVELAGHLCQGRCRRGPNITINGEVHHEVDPISIIALLNHCLPAGNPWTT